MHLRILFGAAVVATAAAAGQLPNQIIVLVDDWGTGYPSWYRGNPLPLVHPEFDELKNQSVILDAAYTYRFCSPSRASLLTGRAGFRHTAAIDNLIPWTRPDCVDRRYEMWPAALKKRGYYSVAVGKWHQGLGESCTPVARGFDESYGFLSGGEDHITQECFNPTKECHCRDLWKNDAASEEPEGTYNTDRFTAYAVRAIQEHASQRPDQPFAMYLALQVTHGPVEAPANATALYNFTQALQNKFHGMVTEASRATGAVADALRAAGMWDNSLLYVLGDNGSPVQVAGSNAHLRGGKGTPWEGGVAVPAFVSGGLVPESQRGTRKGGLFHFSDLYATLLSMAGLDPDSTPGPAPHDGFNMYPYWSGQATASPRSRIVHDHWLANESNSNPTNRSAGSIAQVIDGQLYKLITVKAGEAYWYGWWSPNATCANKKKSDCFSNVSVSCSPWQPCLYNLSQDPGEHHNIAETEPDILKQMQAIMDELDSTYHPPQPSAENVTAYCNAIQAHDGFMAPYFP